MISEVPFFLLDQRNKIIITRKARKSINCQRDPDIDNNFTTVSCIEKPNADKRINTIAEDFLFIKIKTPFNLNFKK